MPYCAYCGKLRETSGGACEQCRLDEAARASRTIGTAAVRFGIASEAILDVVENMMMFGADAAALAARMASEGTD